MRLFIVEDSQIIHDRIVNRFRDETHIQVIGSAKDAGKAIDRICRLRPDVALLDIRLREGNGLDVLRSITTLNPPPIIVVLTNFAYPQYREKFLGHGANYFFDKSTEFDQAIELILALAVDLQNKPEKPEQLSLL